MGKKITIELGKRADLLWYTCIKSILKDQPDRFELIEGRAIKGGYMYFCESYLNAVIIRAYLGSGSIYSDEHNLEDLGFIVISKVNKGAL